MATSGTLTFAAGPATQTVSVTINGDTAVEPNETFFVNLTSPTNGGTIVDGQGVGTITNDDVVGSICDQRRHHHGRQQRHQDGDVHGEPHRHVAAVNVDYATADGTAHGRQRLRGDLGHADLRSGPAVADGRR